MTLSDDLHDRVSRDEWDRIEKLQISEENFHKLQSVHQEAVRHLLRSGEVEEGVILSDAIDTVLQNLTLARLDVMMFQEQIQKLQQFVSMIRAYCSIDRQSQRNHVIVNGAIPVEVFTTQWNKLFPPIKACCHKDDTAPIEPEQPVIPQDECLDILFPHKVRG